MEVCALGRSKDIIHERRAEEATDSNHLSADGGCFQLHDAVIFAATKTGGGSDRGDGCFGNLQLIYEEMQTSLEASDVVEFELLEQNQSALFERQHYYDLFQLCPDAYLGSCRVEVWDC